MPTRRQYLASAALLLAKQASSHDLDSTEPGQCRSGSEWIHRRHRIVILGSSTAAGAGASSYSQSWAGRLAEALSASGFTVINRSLSGTNTATSLSRFEKDVASLFPGYVMLATSIINELVLQLRDDARQTYLQNTTALIREVDRIGAVPIVVGPFPNNAFNQPMRQLMLRIYDDFAAAGVVMWNFMGACDDGAGRWLPGFSEDGLHPTNAGHRAMFESIPVGFFRRAAGASHIPSAWRASGLAWRYCCVGSAPPLLIAPRDPFPSWTLSLWVGSPAVDDNALLTAGPFEIMVRAGSLTVMQGGQSATGALKADVSSVVHLALAANRPRGVLTVWMNGEQVLDWPNVDTTAETFRLASEHTRPGTEYRDLNLYRAPLAGEDIRLLAAGKTPPASLEVALPLNSPPDRMPLNGVSSDTRIEANAESWQVVWSARTLL
jgi:lysophospholipase L1-like esterase